MSNYDMTPTDPSTDTIVEFVMPPRVPEGTHEAELVALKEVSGPSKKNPNIKEKRFVAEFKIGWVDEDGDPQEDTLSAWMNLSHPHPFLRGKAANQLAACTAGEVVGGQVRMGAPLADHVGHLYSITVKYSGEHTNIEDIKKM